jgi:hypothetical protein
MAVWTVDTWRVKPGREGHFLSHCRDMNPDPLILYRDLEEMGLFWSPAKWESLETLRKWRSSNAYGSVVQSLADDVMDHQSHVMIDVPGFLPQTAGSE